MADTLVAGHNNCTGTCFSIFIPITRPHEAQPWPWLSGGDPFSDVHVKFYEILDQALFSEK